MIIELIGPKAAGKTTVAPLLAERLGIAHYRGQAFHGLDGRRLTNTEEWFDRLWSVVASPVLFYNAVRHRPSTGRRINFILNTCRRDRFAKHADEAGSGVIESGPLHGLCQAAAGYQEDMSPLLPHIFRADAYVRLVADPKELQRRFEVRGGTTSERIEGHVDWVDRYETTADAMLARIEEPVWEVDAMQPPDTLADEIAGLLAKDLSSQ